MNNSRFDILAALVLSGEATSIEKIEFEEILKASKEKQIAFEKIKRAWNVNLNPESNTYENQKQQLWERYQVHRKSGNIKGIQYNFALKAAAAILLLLAASFVIYLVLEQNSSRDRDTSIAVKDVVKETRRGEKLKTKLPDGTSVYLNAESKLIYPEHFSDSNRVVHLTGEGFFDVTEDEKRPFTVRTQNMNITALGTSFSISAYNDSHEEQVALVSGKLLIKNVKNQKMTIDSGHTVTLSQSDYRFSTSDLSYLDDVAWKDGILYFNNSSFDDIINVLERNYGVTFILSKNLMPIKDTYSGLFKDEVLDNILKVLSFSMDFQYKINGEDVLIKNKERNV